LSHKLLSLSSKGQYSQVDSAIDKYKKYVGSFDSSAGASSKASKFGAIKEQDQIQEVEEEEDDEEEEEPEELLNEEEIVQKIEEQENKEKEEEEKKQPILPEHKLDLYLVGLERSKERMKELNAICYTYYIVNEPG